MVLKMEQKIKRLSSIFYNMKTRCENKNHKDYKNYGAKGILICKEWSKLKYFVSWALENGYQDNLTIDRKNNDLGYCPDNCRWVDMNTQQSNKRKLCKINSSGNRGVCYNKKNNKYVATIGVNEKRIYIGSFLTSDEAGLAYDNYVKKNRLPHTLNF